MHPSGQARLRRWSDRDIQGASEDFQGQTADLTAASYMYACFSKVSVVPQFVQVFVQQS